MNAEGHGRKSELISKGRATTVLAVVAWAVAAFAAHGALPEAYQQVEWIRANGNQRMNLQYWHTPTTRVEMVCLIPTGGSHYSVIFGSRNNGCSANSCYFSSHFFGTDKPMWSLTGSETSSSTTAYFYAQKIKLRLDCATKYCCWTNELQQGSGFTAGGTATDGKCSWTLFELNKATSKGGVTWDGYRSSATVYAFKIWDGPTLRCNFKPCYRKSDNAVGLYDVVRDLFIENLLTTALEHGEDVGGDFEVGRVDDQYVDGISPCAPTVPVVKNYDTGETLTEGTDFTVEWPDLARPGFATLTVHGKEGTAYAGFVGTQFFNIRLRRDAKKRPYLPAGYVELDSIYGNGSQYLTSGCVHTSDTRVECDLLVPSSANTGSYHVPFGYRNGGYTANAMVFFAKFSGNCACYNRTGKETTGAAFSWNARTRIVAEGATATWTTATTTNSITTTGTCDQGAGAMHVFRHNQGDACAMTLYSFRMIENDHVACWLVPCYRESDGAIGAFDVVQNQSGHETFRANLGSGAFTKGNALFRPTSTDTNLDFYVGRIEADSAGFGWSVNDTNYVGGTLTAEWSTSSAFATSVSTNIGTVTAPYVNYDGCASGLSAATEYHFRMTLSKAGRNDVVRTFTMTTSDGAGTIDASITQEWKSGQDPTFTGSVSVYGSGDIHRLKLCFSTDGTNFDVVDTDDLAAAGNFTLSAPWPVYYQKVWYKIVYENGTAGHLASCETPVNDYTPVYSALFTWRSTVAEGDWTNEDNWVISSCKAANPTERYPRREAYHAVAFPVSSSCVVHLADDAACSYLEPLGSSRARIVGDGDAMPTLTVGRINVCWNAFHLTLDHLACTWTDSTGSTCAGNSGWRDCMAKDGCFRLQGGATLSKTGSGISMLLNKENSRIEVADGSYYDLRSGSAMYVWGPGTEILVDNARFRCGVEFDMSRGGTAPTYRFAGAAPEMTLAGSAYMSTANGISLVFDPPRQGFTNAPLTVTSGVFLSGASGTTTVTVDPSSTVWRGVHDLDFALVRDTNGISTNKVAFAATKRPYGSFYWSPSDAAQPTELRFRYAPPGTRLTVR